MISGRTPLVMALTLAAVAVPAIAWYLVGSAEVERRARRLSADADERLAARAELLASSVGARLERLVEAESRRPFYHYRNLYHDPRGASEGAAVVPSPLAEGPSDPLVRVHFQVDPSGRVNLPTLNDELPELNRGRDVELQEIYRAELAAASPVLLAALGRRAEDAEPETLAARAWSQIAGADWLYSNLRELRAPHPLADADGEAPAVVVCVGPFQWRSLELAGDPTLVALREVETPDGIVVQGFQVARPAIEAWLGSATPARLQPGDGLALGRASLPLAGTAWEVVVEDTPSAAAAVAQARQARATFLRAYAVGVSVAGLAALGAILLAWQAGRLAQERSRFAAAAAHELRTPLTSLRLHAELLARESDAGPAARGRALRIGQDAERLGRVVTNVLSLSRAGTGGLQAEPSDLAGFVRESVDRLAPALEAEGARVEVIAGRDLPDARFDPEAIFRVLQNLLDNAEKYTRGADDRSIAVRLDSESDGSVTLSVEDAGPGVPSRSAGRIFRPFARAAHRDAPAGLGLGLWLSRQLARAHRSELTVGPSDRGGARFAITLPAA